MAIPRDYVWVKEHNKFKVLEEEIEKKCGIIKLPLRSNYVGPGDDEDLDR